jgi:hypothetical protein
MPIEIRGSEHLLEELRLFLGDQFYKRGYEQGPKVGSIDSGETVNFAKGDDIVTVHIKEEDEESLMYVESEKEIPELTDIWDDAIITYGKEVLKRLRNYSINKDKFESGVKRPGS